MKIMIIEDEKKIREELRRLLITASYQVVMVESFKDIPSQVEEAVPDLILLDVNLPEVNGRELCGLIRQRLDMPIIFVTSDDSVTAEIDGMLAGGDDYITKPYHPTLLLARIAAVLKRTVKTSEEEAYLFTHKDVTLDIRSYTIKSGGKQAELSKNECKLLHYLFLHKGNVVSRMDLIEYLWDQEVFIDDNALSITVTRVRSRLQDIGVNDFIETKRGAGYRI